MKKDYPGLMVERLPSGSLRLRVRVEGNKARKITLTVPIDHPQFSEHYWAARAGQKLEPRPETTAPARSLDWLKDKYLAHLARQVEAGSKSPKTLRQRRSILGQLCGLVRDNGDRFGELDIDMPSAGMVEARDLKMATPAQADSMIKAARDMYRFAIERGDIDHNPALGVANIHTPGCGAIPWTPDHLRKFREKHPPGAMAHLWLTLEMFTACRIEDATWIGRAQEVQRDGITWLGWQPRKKGSAFVEIPMLPPLFAATRAQTVIGSAYVLNAYGRPFKSPDTLRNRVADWCSEAGLEGMTSHGIRKAAGSLLAEYGCSQHQIMAIHGHTSPKTSAIYTKGAERRRLAADAMRALAGMDW